ncbi:MAG: hypothetical protein WCF90_04170 [Methanomicrobiales archaeon]
MILVKRCTFLNAGYAIGTKGEHTFPHCVALTLTSIPAVRKDYMARYFRSMCNYDHQCEIKNSRKKKAEEPMPR